MSRHRGADGDMALFASRFVKGRLRGFKKDMEICLSGRPSKERSGITHAYFPALMNCCGMLEYLARLYTGKPKAANGQNLIVLYSRFLPNPDYSDDTIRVLFRAFRNQIAHRGIASGVWRDEHDDNLGRRITWKIAADSRRPAVEVVKESGVLLFDSPWECKFTHRAHIHLGRLWRDIRDSAIEPGGYCDELISDPELLRKFARCMRDLYPP